ncbi:MAG TPA: hypothetical protein VJH03_06335 [Blastocatellia bacterium]|nr:hypothetical protein [Blastocatellia bacterium]
MNEILKLVYNECDPHEAASSQKYLDCGEARGDSALTDQFLKHLELADDYLKVLFSGHVGCGKSSELVRLRDRLKNPATSHRRYFPILLDVSEYLDDFDASLTDILLAIVTELAQTLRDDLGIEIKDNYFAKQFDEVREFLGDLEIKEGEVGLSWIKVKVQRLKRDPDARRKVREALKPRLSNILEEINIVFAKARLEVKRIGVPMGQQPYDDIVLILDNLEKINTFDEQTDSFQSQREFFLEGYTQLTGLDVHVIYTIPLRLARSIDGPKLVQRYDRLLVLPMIKVIDRDTGQPFEAGLECLREILEKRIGGHPIGDVFEPAALEFLLKYSGGHVRNLMTFVQSACTYTDETPIPIAAAQRAVQQSVRTYSTAIPKDHWNKLAELDLSTDKKIDNGDADFLAMLENLSILEYVNGGGEGSFEAAEPWCAVNPVVRELQKFKAAIQELSTEQKQ